MKLIIGLGNPGLEYTYTRHNVGFLFLDFLLSKNNIAENWKKDSKLKALVQTITIENQIILLAKPQTYMNLSGQSAQAIKSFYKLKNSDIITVFDDIDLSFQTIRFKSSGSAGTHNGMKSLIQELSDQNFARLKIGIESRGTHAPARQDLSSFVLSRFSPEEMDLLDEIFENAYSELTKWLKSA